MQKKATGIYQLHRNPVQGAKAQRCIERQSFRDHLRVTGCLISLFLQAYLLPAEDKSIWGMGADPLIQVSLGVENEAAS